MFITEDFLLDTGWSRKLYHEVAADLPIIDYHAHLRRPISPRADVPEHRRAMAGQRQLRRPCYKWRLMRAAGVPSA